MVNLADDDILVCAQSGGEKRAQREHLFNTAHHILDDAELIPPWEDLFIVSPYNLYV